MQKTVVGLVACFSLCLSGCGMSANIHGQPLPRFESVQPSDVDDHGRASRIYEPAPTSAAKITQMPENETTRAPELAPTSEYGISPTPELAPTPENEISPTPEYGISQTLEPAWMLGDQNIGYADAKVIVSGKEITFANQGAVIKDGEVFVPVVGVFEHLDGANENKDAPFTVNWDDQTSTATIKNRWYAVTVVSGEQAFTCNGKMVTPAAPPQTINGVFMLPLAAIAKAIDATTHWDESTSTISMFYESMVKAD